MNRNLLTVLVGFAVVGLALGMLPTDARAQDTVTGETSLVVPAGGEATVDFEGLCLEFGEPFPDEVQVPDGTFGADDARRVMKTAVRSGLAVSDILQTQIAVWYSIEGEWGYNEDDVDLTPANDLVEAASDETLDPLTGRGTALDEAMADGSIVVTVTKWEQTDAPKVFESDAPYYGTGTLTLTNPGDTELLVYYPIGLMLPAVNDSQQNMGTFAHEQQEVEMPETLPKTGAEGNFGPLALALLGLGLITAGVLRRS